MHHIYIFIYCICACVVVVVMMETERMKKLGKVVNEMKVVLTMLAVSVSFAAAAILYKIVTLDGMSFMVLNAYRFIFSTAFMLPLSLFTDRKPKLSWKVFFMAFMCGLFGGTIFQGLQMESLVLTTATFVSASLNLIPAITFVMALPFRLESLNLGEGAGWAKLMGTIAGIGGAMMMTFVKGPRVKIFHSHLNLRHHHHAHVALHNDIARQALGVVCAIGSCFAYAFWLIIQGVMSRTPSEYPSHLTNTALMSTMAAIQSTAFGLCVERDWSQWKLGWDLRLFTVVYAGVVASGVMVIGIAWCVEMKGPLFVSVFTPIMFFLVLIAASFVLDEKLFLGTAIGAVLIVLGLYLVLWGKENEVNKMKRPQPQHPTLPLNHHHTTTNTTTTSDHSIVSKNQQQEQDRHESAATNNL